MGNLSDELRESAKKLKQTADYIEKGTEYIDKGSKFTGYWLNSDQRKQIKAEAESWKKKEARMTKIYICLWIIMIIATIYLCIQ